MRIEDNGAFRSYLDKMIREGLSIGAVFKLEHT